MISAFTNFFTGSKPRLNNTNVNFKPQSNNDKKKKAR